MAAASSTSTRARRTSSSPTSTTPGMPISAAGRAQPCRSVSSAPSGAAAGSCLRGRTSRRPNTLRFRAGGGAARLRLPRRCGMAVIPWQVVVTPHDGGGAPKLGGGRGGAGAAQAPAPHPPPLHQFDAAYPDKTVQLLGTFGGNLLIEGSMDLDESTAVYATLADPQGNALSGISAAKIENVLEHVYLLRPSAGASVSDVDVWLLLSNVRG